MSVRICKVSVGIEDYEILLAVRSGFKLPRLYEAMKAIDNQFIRTC